ncbi:MAG: extracellular solute-binding protein [Candidatus Bathyarchaeota archaeon]|jgi:ABC-type glycerol-3-phosphate transport system substrate-binding protein|nr:MAG: extracellular solute-binding protein [Candidatus Bathyarchaeota archaeon]
MSKVKAVAMTVWAAIIIIIIVIAAIAVYWYMGQPAGPVEKKITIAWTEGPEFDVMEARLSDFEDDTGIDVVLETIPRDQIIVRLMLEMLSDEPKIDGTVMYSIELPTLAATGKLIDLYEYRTRQGLLDDGFYADQLDVIEIDEKLYYLPGLWNGALILYYYEPYFEDTNYQTEYENMYPGEELKVPETPEELMQVAEFWDKVEDDTVDGLGPGGMYPIHLQGKIEMGGALYTIFPPMVADFGGGFYDPDTGDIPANSSETVEALQYLVDLSQHAQPTMLVDGTFEGEIAILEGKCIMADQWTYIIGMLDDPEASQVVGEMGIAMRPFSEPPDIMGISILDTPKKDLVWQFVEWVASPEIATEVCYATPKAPSRSQVLDDPRISEAPWLDVVWDSFGRVKQIIPPIRDPRSIEINDAMMKRVHQALTGESTPQAAMDALYEDIAYIVGA